MPWICPNCSFASNEDEIEVCPCGSDRNVRISSTTIKSQTSFKKNFNPLNTMVNIHFKTDQSGNSIFCPLVGYRKTLGLYPEYSIEANLLLAAKQQLRKSIKFTSILGIIFIALGIIFKKPLLIPYAIVPFFIAHFTALRRIAQQCTPKDIYP